MGLARGGLGWPLQIVIYLGLVIERSWTGPLFYWLYLLIALHSHQITSPSSAHGSSALNTIATSNTTSNYTAVRFVKAFASSLMKRQRGIRAICS